MTYICHIVWVCFESSVYSYDYSAWCCVYHTVFKFLRAVLSRFTFSAFDRCVKKLIDGRLIIGIVCNANLHFYILIVCYNIYDFNVGAYITMHIILHFTKFLIPLVFLNNDPSNPHTAIYGNIKCNPLSDKGVQFQVNIESKITKSFSKTYMNHKMHFFTR